MFSQNGLHILGCPILVPFRRCTLVSFLQICIATFIVEMAWCLFFDRKTVFSNKQQKELLKYVLKVSIMVFIK